MTETVLPNLLPIMVCNQSAYACKVITAVVIPSVILCY